MRRAAGMLAIVAAAGLAGAPPAGAWTTLEPYDVASRGAATCLRDAGGGRLAILGPPTRATTPVDVLSAGDGASPRLVARTVPGWLDECPAVAPADPALIAGPIRARPPRWRPTVLAVGAGERLARTRARGTITAVDAAEAPSGAAVVAWAQVRDPLAPRVRVRVHATVRPPGAARFGPAQSLGTGWPRRPIANVHAGIASDGRATVAWTGRDRTASAQPDLVAATSDPHGAFAQPRRIARLFGDDPVALAVSPDGRALLVAETPEGLTPFERPPGARRFEALALDDDGRYDLTELALAMDDDGGALLAFRTPGGGIMATTRSPGGPFGSPRAAVADPDPNASAYGELDVDRFGGRRPRLPEDDAGRELAAAVRGGEAILTWVPERDGAQAAGVRVARGDLRTGLGRPRRLGSRCRPTTGARPFRLADGRLGLAWAENVTRSTGLGEWPAGHGRVRVAVPGAAASPPPAPGARPRVEARVSRPRALRPGDRLHVRVRCAGGPCELRVSAVARPPDRLDRHRAVATAVLAAGATRTLTLDPGSGATFGRHRGRREVTVVACGLDGRIARRTILRPRLRRRPPPPLARPVDARATRTPGGIRVTWRTARPARRMQYVVVPRGAGTVHAAARRGRGRTRFAVTLRPPRPGAVRTVVVYANDRAAGRHAAVSVRVT